MILHGARQVQHVLLGRANGKVGAQHNMPRCLALLSLWQPYGRGGRPPPHLSTLRGADAEGKDDEAAGSSHLILDMPSYRLYMAFVHLGVVLALMLSTGCWPGDGDMTGTCAFDGSGTAVNGGVVVTGGLDAHGRLAMHAYDGDGVRGGRVNRVTNVAPDTVWATGCVSVGGRESAISDSETNASIWEVMRTSLSLWPWLRRHTMTCEQTVRKAGDLGVPMVISVFNMISRSTTGGEMLGRGTRLATDSLFVSNEKQVVGPGDLSVSRDNVLYESATNMASISVEGPRRSRYGTWRFG